MKAMNELCCKILAKIYGPMKNSQLCGKSLWLLHFISKVSMFEQLWWY